MNKEQEVIIPPVNTRLIIARFAFDGVSKYMPKKIHAIDAINIIIADIK